MENTKQNNIHEISIIFKVKGFTLYSENIFVVGSCKEIGNWNPNFSIKLTPSKYPLWESPPISINYDKIKDLQYKYIKKYNGNITWELGANRNLQKNINNFTSVIIVNDEEFCSEFREFLVMYGYSYKAEIGKKQELSFEYKKPLKVLNLCTKCKNQKIQFLNSTDFLYIIDFLTHAFIQIKTQFHRISIFSKNTFFMVLNKGILKCKYKRKTHKFTANFIKTKNLLWPSEIVYFNLTNFLYIINIEIIEKINLSNYKSYIFNEKFMNSNYKADFCFTQNAQLISQRYLYLITTNYVKRYDILDEENGWEIIGKFNKFSFYPQKVHFIRFCSDKEFVLFKGYTGIFYKFNIFNLDEYCEIGEHDRLEIFNCPLHNEIFYLRNEKYNLLLNAYSYNIETSKFINKDFILDTNTCYNLEPNFNNIIEFN